VQPSETKNDNTTGRVRGYVSPSKENTMPAAQGAGPKIATSFPA